MSVCVCVRVNVCKRVRVGARGSIHQLRAIIRDPFLSEKKEKEQRRGKLSKKKMKPFLKNGRNATH